MAGDDWIKMRTDLYRHPKVCVMSDSLLDSHSELSRYVSQNNQCDMSVTRNVTRSAVVGALVSVWGVVRHRGKRIDADGGTDLILEKATLLTVDDIADLPGFGDSMSLVGWAVETKEGVVFPRFFEQMNVDPAEEKRQQDAQRQRKYRARKAESECHDSVTQRSHENVTLEKRREEKSNKEKGGIKKQPPAVTLAADLAIAESLKTPEVLAAVQEWIDYKRERGDVYKRPSYLANKINTFQHEGSAVLVAAIRHSIGSTYDGIFRDKSPAAAKPVQTKARPPTDEEIAKLNEGTLDDDELK